MKMLKCYLLFFLALSGLCDNRTTEVYNLVKDNEANWEKTFPVAFAHCYDLWQLIFETGKLTEVDMKKLDELSDITSLYDLLWCLHLQIVDISYWQRKNKQEEQLTQLKWDKYNELLIHNPKLDKGKSIVGALCAELGKAAKEVKAGKRSNKLSELAPQLWDEFKTYLNDELRERSTREHYSKFDKEQKEKEATRQALIDAGINPATMESYRSIWDQDLGLDVTGRRLQIVADYLKEVEESKVSTEVQYKYLTSKENVEFIYGITVQMIELLKENYASRSATRKNDFKVLIGYIEKLCVLQKKEVPTEFRSAKLPVKEAEKPVARSLTDEENKHIEEQMDRYIEILDAGDLVGYTEYTYNVVLSDSDKEILLTPGSEYMLLAESFPEFSKYLKKAKLAQNRFYENSQVSTEYIYAMPSKADLKAFKCKYLVFRKDPKRNVYILRRFLEKKPSGLRHVDLK